MLEGVQLKYGYIRGGSQGTQVTPLVTQYFAAAGAKFVKRTATNSDYVTLATQTDSEIIGHLETEQLNSSLGTEVRKLITDPTAIYRVPSTGTAFTKRFIGKRCDLLVASGVQKAALNSCLVGQLIIVGGDDTNSKWVDVMINQTLVDGIRTGVA